MSSKAFVFLILPLSFVFLLSSEVAARDLVETSSKKDNEAKVETNGIENAKYVGGYGSSIGGGSYGGGSYGGGSYGGGGYGGGSYGGGSYGGGGYGRGCTYGRCGYRCCRYAGEVVEGAKP